MQDNELRHYGVLGMKWGVYKARKRARKEDTTRSRFSTGKNYDEVYNKMREAKKPLNDSYGKELRNLLDDYPNSAGKINRLTRNYYKKSAKLVDKFLDDFNEATLKDIKYKDIEKGKAILKKKKEIIFSVEL